MNLLHLLLFILLGCFTFSCTEIKQNQLESGAIAIIPEPYEMSINEGVFEFDRNTKLVATDQTHNHLLTRFSKKFKTAAGFEPSIVKIVPNDNYIILRQDGTLEEESYRLAVTSNQVELRANGLSGYLYGLETIRQLLPSEIESDKESMEVDWTIPCLKIKDRPNYPWRGLMLDVSRHFFKKEYVLKTIDRMALFKLNTLHLHLVDDQGWRLEIANYPKLTEVGAYRVNQEEKHWDARAKNNPNDKGTYGGFYTKEDLIEIVEYAKDRGIRVVPEIEMPAHVMSALAAYPEFSCFGKHIAVPSGGVWPITDIYCPGKEITFEFLQNVLLEVMEIFPSKYIHVGGDEATRTNWEKCADCQRRMREEDLNTTAELQTYFIQRIERFLSSHGRILVGWDEIIEGGLPSGSTVMSWRGIEGGWEASNAGHDVIMTPNTVYLNQYQGEPDYEPIAFGGYVPLNQVYAFDPVVDSMSSAQKKHILGSQANLWSEFIADEDESEYMLFPRLAALSEALWTPKEKKDWNRFSEKIPPLFDRFDAMGITYARSAYAVTSPSKLNDDGSITVQLKNEFSDSEIRYAMNNDVLSATSDIYTDPITLENTTTITAAVFENGEIVGDTLTKTFNFHKAVGKRVSYEPKYTKQYSGTGENTTVNVLRGSKNFHDGQWLAWLEEDAEITINLEGPTVISSVAVGTMENQGSGIYYPTKIEVFVSDDGINFKKAGKMVRPHQPNGYVGLKDFKVEIKQQTTRWVRVHVTNLAHPPTGGSCFLFLDEIIVE